MEQKFSKKEQDKQIKKEIKISMVVYLCYFIWWLATGFGLGSKDPSEYTYVMGLPMWFILSCIIGPILFCIASIILVKFVFKDFSLEETTDDTEGGE